MAGARRQRVARAVHRLGDRIGDTNWSIDPDKGGPQTAQRVGARRFKTVEEVQALARALQKELGPPSGVSTGNGATAQETAETARVTVYCAESAVGEGPTFDGMLDRLCGQTLTARRRLIITGPLGASRWTVTITQPGRRVAGASVSIGGNLGERITYENVFRAIDSSTHRYRIIDRIRKTPVVQPRTERTHDDHEHDMRLTRRAASWGALLGAIAATAANWVLEALAGGPTPGG